MVLNQLRKDKEVDAQAVGRFTRRGETCARTVVDRLVERGLILRRDDRGREVYQLSPVLKRRLSDQTADVHPYHVSKRD